MCLRKPQRSCFLIGHRDAPPGICPRLAAEIERHITELGVTDFYVGHFGSFDQYAADLLCEAKKQHPEIHLHIAVAYPKNLKLVIPKAFDPFPHYPARDLDRVPKQRKIQELQRAMVRNCDYLIAYAHHPRELAHMILLYAKKIKQPSQITNIKKPNSRRAPKTDQ